jgi:signal transduction histidine kinase
MFLKLVANLSDSNDRFYHATRLAEFLGSSYLLILVRDPEINTLLPAPGFPQTLPFDKGWESLINETLQNAIAYGELAYPDKRYIIPAIGISVVPSSIALLLGGEPKPEAIEQLKNILPMLSTLFIKEQEIITAKTAASIAEKAAVKAEKLAKTIDAMRMKLNEALIRQEKDKHEIEQLLKKKDEFMNIASHELKTPMTSLKGYLQLLSKNKVIPSNLNGFLQKANIQADKVTNLINDLLDVSKIQSGQMIFSFSQFNFHELIVEVASGMQMTSNTHQIKILASTDAIIKADRVRLEQVLVNLISNAIKYSPDASHVEICSFRDGSYIQLEITDFGIGIESEKVPYIFDRFFRVDNVVTKFSGLGLGLFITKEIVMRHDGEIGLRSTPERGSTFWVRLPVLELANPILN